MPENYIDKIKKDGIEYNIHDSRMPSLDGAAGKVLAINEDEDRLIAVDVPKVYSVPEISEMSSSFVDSLRKGDFIIDSGAENYPIFQLILRGETNITLQALSNFDDETYGVYTIKYIKEDGVWSVDDMFTTTIPSQSSPSGTIKTFFGLNSGGSIVKEQLTIGKSTLYLHKCYVEADGEYIYIVDNSNDHYSAQDMAAAINGSIATFMVNSQGYPSKKILFAQDSGYNLTTYSIKNDGTIQSITYDMSQEVQSSLEVY